MFMFKPFAVSSCLLLATLSSSAYAGYSSYSGGSQEIFHWRQFNFENDAVSIVNPSDDGYSNGLLFFWGTANHNNFESLELPSWLHFLTHWSYINQDNNGKYSIAYNVSQLMHTPDALEVSEVVEDDVPYAGVLTWEGKIRHYGNDRANSLGLTLGLVGSLSLAGISQKLIHEAIGATDPKGWDNQLDNEPVLRIEGEHIERFYVGSFNNGIAFDGSSYSILGIGNLKSDVGTGVTLRLGDLLDQTYATINPISSTGIVAKTINNQFYWQVYSSLYAQYVFNDITLDGNTFSDSHSVELIHEQIMATIGVAFLYNDWGVGLSIHRGNDRFEEQQTISKYGSVSITYNF